MQKIRIDKFIQKYNLNGQVEQVKWAFKNNKLVTEFVTEDKSLKGTVMMDNITFEDTELGVYDTAQLQKLLSVLGDDVSMSVNKIGDRSVSLSVKNGIVSVDYNLSDLSIIPEPMKIKYVPDFNTQIKIDSNFINTFIKGKGALADSPTFSLLKHKGIPMVVIGYSNTNTNRVNIPIETLQWDISDTITFNAEMFKDVLVANKDCTSAVLEVSNEGLARINFKVSDYESEYYIVATQSAE